MTVLWQWWSRSPAWWNIQTRPRLCAEVASIPAALSPWRSPPHCPSVSFVPGYWPSYNIPFHRSIYTLSGYVEMWKEYGEDFSYDLCPRAKIFRRDQAAVKDLDSLKHIMRFNGNNLFFCNKTVKYSCFFVIVKSSFLLSDYKKDPYSKGDPCKSICCRNDLKSGKSSPDGCYDSKVLPDQTGIGFVTHHTFINAQILTFSWAALLPGDRFLHGRRFYCGGGERSNHTGWPPTILLGQIQQHQSPGPAEVLQLHFCDNEATYVQTMMSCQAHRPWPEQSDWNQTGIRIWFCEWHTCP